MSNFNKTFFTDVFAPDHGYLSSTESTYRCEICLNGTWQFQPMWVPVDYKRDIGIPPELPMPDEKKWSKVPIRIPSPWNGNKWGNGRIDRSDNDVKFRPDSLYYPSYPKEWDKAEMGWLRRSFAVPEEWQEMRIILHFEAIMGHADVYVNGSKVGEHFDGYLPFEFDVTNYVQKGINELLVGIQHLRLYNHQSKKYCKMCMPYAHGSNTQDLVGIWQDVYLLAVPICFVDDVYVKPLVDIDTLELDVTIRNNMDTPQRLEISTVIRPWIDTSVDAIPSSRLGDTVMAIPDQVILVSPHSSLVVTVKEKVKGRLAFWTLDTPNLYSAEISLVAQEDVCDCKSTRFGWRQYRLGGQNLYLNGTEIHLYGDICHPFGPFMFSRRFIRSWYKFIKSVGGNAVRLHAQIHPQVFLDVADEMGIAVLDETAIFGSCLTLNFEDEIAWERYAAHYDGLIMRDRNRPSVFGWSFGNELFAIFLYDEVAKRDEYLYYPRLFALANRTRALDVTREFVTCDGDEDLKGTLPVWSKHYGHGRREFDIPTEKPVVIGENGGTYYARPEQMAEFNGDLAFESYSGRNYALGIDLYQQLKVLGNRLAYFSASELMWFGLEHLPYGYSDFTRLPTFEDGVFFTNFEEGRPGMYIERIPPYVGTLNPGFDPSLPEYKPLAMAEAMKDALLRDESLDEKWEPVKDNRPKPPAYEYPHIVCFAGAQDGEVCQTLKCVGAEISEEGEFFVLDGSEDGEYITSTFDRIHNDGGTGLILIPRKEIASRINTYLPFPVVLTNRSTTMLVRDSPHPWVDSMTIHQMYFAENSMQKHAAVHGITGKWKEKGCSLLCAGNVDWSLFNNIPENAKCGSVVLYEQLKKEDGSVLISHPFGKGTLVFSTILCVPQSKEHITFWRNLLNNMGVRLGMVNVAEDSEQKYHDLLLNGPIED